MHSHDGPGVYGGIVGDFEFTLVHIIQIFQPFNVIKPIDFGAAIKKAFKFGTVDKILGQKAHAHIGIIDNRHRLIWKGSFLNRSFKHDDLSIRYNFFLGSFFLVFHSAEVKKIIN